MQVAEKDIHLGGEHFVLTNQRALYWPRYRSLVLSDLHVGKAAHFRKHGMAVPSSVMHKDLDRLKGLCKFFDAKEIVVAGDLLHASENSDVAYFSRWLEELQGIETILVEGNHDRISKKRWKEIGVGAVLPELTRGPVTVVHEFKADFTGFQINGHVHPGVVLQSKTGRLRLPCFLHNPGSLLLPAFSTFTGLDTTRTPKGDVYCFDEDSIFTI